MKSTLYVGDPVRITAPGSRELIVVDASITGLNAHTIEVGARRFDRITGCEVADGPCELFLLEDWKHETPERAWLRRQLRGFGLSFDMRARSTLAAEHLRTMLLVFDEAEGAAAAADPHPITRPRARERQHAER